MDKKNISFTFGTRLKELRQECGLSHVQLRDQLKDRYGISVSRDSLMAYEVADDTRSKAEKLPNLGMRVEYLYCLADFYGVSLDYLVGNSDYYDIKHSDLTIETMGLPEKFVSEYLNIRDKKNFGNRLVNKFLSNWRLWEAMVLLYAVDELPMVKSGSPESTPEFRKLQEDILRESEGLYCLANTGYLRDGMLFKARELLTKAFAQSTRFGIQDEQKTALSADTPRTETAVKKPVKESRPRLEYTMLGAVVQGGSNHRGEHKKD